MSVVLRLLVLFFVAFAPMAAMAAQKAIGTACSGDTNAADWDAIAQCNGTTFIKAPLMLGAVASPPYSTTACDASKAGMLQYTGGVVQYCNSSAWGTLLTSTSTIGSGVYLGASTAATNPQRSGEVNTGLFSPATGVVAVSSLGAEALRVTATGSVGIGTTAPTQALDVAGSVNMSGNLGVGSASVSSAYGVHIGGTSTNASQMGIRNILTVTGTLSAARTNYGTVSQITSTAVNTSFANNLYGVYTGVTNSAGTGYDTAYGSYGYVTNNDTSLTNATSVGAYGQVANASTGTLTAANGVQGYTTNNSTGTITTAKGIYGYARNAVAGTVTTAYGSHGIVLNDGYGTITTAYGALSQVRNDEGTMTTAVGNYSWVQQATATGSIDTSYGYYSRLDRDAGTMGTGYLYYGVFEGTHTTKYGIYLSGETSNYLSGRLGIGTDSPEDVLDVVGTRWIVGSSRADATIKYWRPALYNYNNADGTFVPFFAYSNSSNNGLTIGGGTSTGNAATVLYFNTAANQTTTSGTTRMIITSTGSVGIGTTTPEQALDVTGAVQLSGNLMMGNGPYLRAKNSSGTYENVFWPRYTNDATYLNYGDGGFHIRNNSSTITIYLSATNSVGIGNTPAVSLDLAGKTDAVRIPAGTSLQRPTGAVGMIRYNSTTAAYEGYTTAWNSFVDSSALSADVILGASTAATNPHRSGDATTGLFSPAASTIGFATAGSEAMRITATNSIGIGTTSPAYKVQIAETSTTSASRGLHVAHSGAISGTGYAGVFSKTGASTTNVGLHTSASGATNNYGLLVANGDVGIGTTTPSYKLDVWGGMARITNAGNTSGLEIGNGQTANNFAYVDLVGDTTYSDYGLRLMRDATGANTASYLTHRGTGRFFIGANEAGSLSLVTAATERLTVTATGSVGIVTTTPSYPLHVVGEIYGSTDITAGGDIYANGTYIYGDSKSMLRYSDLWLRLNPDNAFTSGTYAGTGIFRTDGTLQVGASGATLNVESGGDLSYKGSLIFGDYSANRVGIGTTSPAYALDVSGDVNMSGNLGVGSASVSSAYGINVAGTSTNASQQGIRNQLAVGGTLSAARTNYGIVNQVTSTAVNTSFANNLYADYNQVINSAGTGYDTAYGAYNYVVNNDTSLTNATSIGAYNRSYNAATGTMTNSYGSYNYAQNNTGTTTSAVGTYSNVYNTTGTITTAVGNYTWIRQNGTGGSIDAAYGYFSRLDRDAGTMGTGYLYYGVFEGTHTTKYGIYLSGETSNYFSGNVGIGTDAPGQALDVSGIAQATNFRVASGNGNGIGLWGQTPATYGIFMSNDAAYQYGGVADYYIANVMSSGVNRGFVWSYGTTPSMALNASTGNLQIKGTLTAEGTGTSSFGGLVDTVGSVRVSSSGGTGATFLTLGRGTTGDHYSYIDFIGDSTYTTYGLRLIRNNNGANANSVLVHRGTGILGINAADAGSISLQTNGSTRLYVTATGSVGIKVTTPGVSLVVNATDAIQIPVGTSAQRPTAAVGQIRYNTNLSQFEGYNGSAWVALGAGSSGYERITATCGPTAGVIACTATCSSGKKVLGGGGRSWGGTYTLYASYPPNDSSWYVNGTTSANSYVDAYAICASM